MDDVVANYHTVGGPVKTRYTRFFNDRFCGDWGHARDTATVAYTPPDALSLALWDGIVVTNVDNHVLLPGEWNTTAWAGLQDALLDILMGRVNAETP